MTENTDITEFIQYYTIIFRDKYEVDIPEKTYQEIKRKIANKEYEIEIGWSLYNMHYTNYKRIEKRAMASNDDISIYIARLPDKKMKDWINMVKREREANFPFKRPFASIEHLQEFIKIYNNWWKI